jgi:hypothetical protein
MLALLMGGYNDAMGNTTRAFFNISGPLLSLSVATFLVEAGDRQRKLKLRGQDEAALHR